MKKKYYLWKRGEKHVVAMKIGNKYRTATLPKNDMKEIEKAVYYLKNKDRIDAKTFKKFSEKVEKKERVIKELKTRPHIRKVMKGKAEMMVSLEELGTPRMKEALLTNVVLHDELRKKVARMEELWKDYLEYEVLVDGEKGFLGKGVQKAKGISTEEYKRKLVENGVIEGAFVDSQWWREKIEKKIFQEVIDMKINDIIKSVRIVVRLWGSKA